MSIPDGYFDIPPGKIAAVVTSLEMLAPPVIPPDPAGDWTLRRVAQPDLDWYRDLYARVGWEWLWSQRTRMSDAELARTIRADGVEITTLEHDGGDEALLELDFRNKNECELVLFGVTSKLIGTGAGRLLMNHALRRAWARPLTRLWVHTCSFDHPRALAFYQRSGFRPYRRQIEIAPDPRLDGTLPRDVARHVPLLA
ncbi:N-acetyltransferase [Bradyrhizobium sp. SSBR45G]|uniref:GNAT family N-acetyltransferase n=1 Tax=unclassified Bradyrhizobium TaxID=2631580 RepID=UPI0023429E69|nr:MULTISPECIES: GNAT family N-acetyltransferase [unclassified Bradyrhizobium]GLH79264.1 N-acetyltransferase [Bradyrhizobium sp. SSBR45G]GLH84699.1 N-acetyltransferase [Bradyrhizobium sp. SSBR45R]